MEPRHGAAENKAADGEYIKSSFAAMKPQQVVAEKQAKPIETPPSPLRDLLAQSTHRRMGSTQSRRGHSSSSRPTRCLSQQLRGEARDNATNSTDDGTHHRGGGFRVNEVAA